MADFQLAQLNIGSIPQVFPDHHNFQAEDIEFGDDLPIIMTEKDAVKCATFADARFYVARGKVQCDEKLLQAVLFYLHRN